MVTTRDRVYRAFFGEKESSLYYNQIKELTRLSHSSLQNTLKKLVKDKELKIQKTKSNMFYELTNKNKSIEFARIILDMIENLNLDVKIPVKEVVQKAPKAVHAILFFGSASIGQEQESSDIDLLVILENFKSEEFQKLYEKEIKKEMGEIKKEIMSKSIYPLSITYVTKEEFNKQDDFLIREAKETGYPIINQLNYIK